MNCQRLRASCDYSEWYSIIDSARPVCGEAFALHRSPLAPGCVFYALCTAGVPPDGPRCSRAIDHAGLAASRALGYAIQAAACWDSREAAKWSRKAVDCWRVGRVDVCGG